MNTCGITSYTKGNITYLRFSERTENSRRVIETPFHSGMKPEELVLALRDFANYIEIKRQTPYPA